METLDNYTYIGNVKSRLLMNNKPVTVWCKNSVCRLLAVGFKKAGIAKESELSIEVWKSANQTPD